ncbi:centriole and centriolar satellite protein ofd1 isoform X1 [Paramormyrops kingsleyae]|uniref:centriole and centriolar satellite protein ofd1 isoform X1 n=1 Tax=Paramormyrops kingsleyae TaxID=1676925 RepID=UPI003B97ADDF
MSAVKEDVISPDEMRKRLYQTFKNRGVVDALKTQLRNQLIHELKHPEFGGDRKPSPLPNEADSVMLTASNSLVLDHLEKAGYEYTLSVFYPESGMAKDRVFSTKDLLRLLNISPQSAFYKSLTSGMQNDTTCHKGFLMQLLTELTDYHMHQECRDADTQTDFGPHYRESLVEKFQMIEDKYAALREQGSKCKSLEAKMLECRKEIESQLQAEMDAKLQHFKEAEVAKIKLEEKEKTHKEVQQLRREMERTYEKKWEGLISREQHAIERLQKQQEIEERDLYKQRQALLSEIEAVRSREAELRLTKEAFEKMCKLQEEKNRSSEELLRRRELAVKTLEDTYDQKLKNELTRYQLELKEEYLRRTEKLAEDEERVKAEAARLHRHLASVDTKAEEHRQACATLGHLKAELDAVLAQNALLTREKEGLQGRLDAVSDYAALRRDGTELRAQIGLVRKQLEQLQEENRQLRAEMSQPSKAQLAMQVELHRVEEARKLEEEEFESQKQLLQMQLQAEVERNAQLEGQLSQCQQRAQWMSAHVEEMKLQLQQTQLALENEVLRNPKPSLVDRSVLELSADKLVPPDIYVDGPAARRREARVGVAETCRRWPLRARSASPDPDAELVAGAKARIRELEKEAEALEEAYRHYQQRATRLAAAGLQVPRARSPQLKAHSFGSGPPPAPQPRVTFPHEGPLAPSLLHEFVSAKLLESLDFREERAAGEQTPPGGSDTPPRRLSSTPLSITKRQLPRKTVEDAGGSPVMFSSLSPTRQLSPIPRGRAMDMSPPGSPPLRSTAREPYSSPIAPQSDSSSGSSPHPEKISLQDLTELPQEPSCIPELLQDERDHLSAGGSEAQRISPPGAEGRREEATPHILDGQSTEIPVRQEEEEDGGVKLELEGQIREERWRQEGLESLERPEEQRLLEEGGMSQEWSTKGDKTTKQEGGVADTVSKSSETSPTLDPLAKYMRIVMQGKEAEPDQHPGKDEAEGGSLAAGILSDDKDNSIITFSQDEADEDFW